MTWSRHAAIVIAVAALVMFTNLGGPLLWDRDEPRNAGCAAEMLARGDWVTPVFNAELRAHKPVLLYWLMMTAYSLMGVSELAARLPSALLAVGTALCTYALGRRLLGARAGLWAGLAVTTTLMFGVAGRAATPDSALIFFSTLAITIYVYGSFGAAAMQHHGDHGPRPNTGRSNHQPTSRHATYFPQRWPVVAAMYAVMGLAVLTKGPVGLVLPTAVIGMFLLIARLPQRVSIEQKAGLPFWSRVLRGLRRVLAVCAPLHFLRTCWAMRPLTALAACLAVALPWYVWVGARTDGEFLRVFFLDHNLGRAVQTLEGHDGSLLYYPVAILIGAFPWSVLAVPIGLEVAAGFRRGDPRRPAYLLALCWIGVYVGVFSLAQTKLPSYVTPCYPALALLAGGFVDRWLADRASGRQLWRQLAFASLTVIGLLLVVALPLAARRYLRGDELLGVVGLIPAAGGIACLLLAQLRRPHLAAITFAATATLFVTAVLAGAAQRVSQHQKICRLLNHIAEHNPGTQVAAFGALEPTWVFYGGRPVHELHTSGQSVATGQWVEIEGRWRPKPPLGLDELTAGAAPALIITTGRQFERLRSLLPGGVDILADVPYFLKDERLLLVRTQPSPLYTLQPADPPAQRR